MKEAANDDGRSKDGHRRRYLKVVTIMTISETVQERSVVNRAHENNACVIEPSACQGL